MPASTTTNPPKKNAKVERLKKQGNERIAKGQYAAAYKKYTEALEEDPRDATLWANRAACSLGNKRYMETTMDAKKAVDLDANHHKAWSRLGEAYFNLSHWPQSIQAWEKALEILNQLDSLSAQEQMLKKSYQKGLNDARAASKKPGAEVYVVCAMSHDDPYLQQFPWTRSQQMYERLAKEGTHSSALAMMGAYENFLLGIGKMSKTKITRVSRTQWQVEADWMVLTHLSNAINRDARVFHCPGPDFLGAVKETMDFNTRHAGAWTDQSFRTLKKKAPILLENKGWPVVQRALTVTVRCWMLKGLLQQIVQRVSTDFFRSALDVLEWGRKVWPDVRRADRGTIFDLSFVRGVQRLHLNSLMDALGNNRPTTRNETDEDVAHLAQQIISSAEADTYVPKLFAADIYDTWPQYASFWLYTKATAYAAMGWCRRRASIKATGSMQKGRLLREAADFYVRAANEIPEDDEYYASFLVAAIRCSFILGAPLHLILPLCARIRLALPGIQAIWEHSGISETIQRDTSGIITFETECVKKIQDGTITDDAVVNPEQIKPLYQGNLPEEFSKSFSARVLDAPVTRTESQNPSELLLAMGQFLRMNMEALQRAAGMA